MIGINEKNIILLKIAIVLICTIVPVVINYFLIGKISQKLFRTSVIVVILVNVFSSLLDYVYFKSELIDFIASGMLISFLLSITFEDIKANVMDMRVITGFFILFLVYRIMFLDLPIFLEGAVGCILSLVLMTIAYFIRKNSIGGGDIATIAACGTIVGFPNIFHFLFKTFLFVFIYGLFLIITKKKDAIDEIPLAPFLLLATII